MRVLAVRVSCLCSLVPLLLLLGCNKPQPSPAPRTLPSGATQRDLTFYSPALQRNTTYRLITPAAYQPNQPIHVLYLLHGAGGSYRDWSDTLPTATLLPGYVLVMPFGANGYWVNSVYNPKDRYEDFLTEELIKQVEPKLPAGPKTRAIAGTSMGGFGAIVLAYRHPDLFPFAAALSPPVDLPERPFSFHRLGQSLSYRQIFGPVGSPTRQAADPFVLARTASRAPYLFLSTGHEPLEAPIRRFEATLTRYARPHEFHTQPGRHDPAQWANQLPALVDALNRRQNP